MRQKTGPAPSAERVVKVHGWRRSAPRLALLGAAGMAWIAGVPGTSLAAGLLKSVDEAGGGVQIREHRVQVTLNNGFAQTEVDQTFFNPEAHDLEAAYSFPLPKQASLSELSLWIDGSEVLGEVVEKKRARRIYQEQKARGNDTALAEQDEFKTFEIRVGRVPARAQTRVRLVYYQPIEIDLGVGRYLYPLAEGNVDEERISFWSVDDQVEETFSFRLVLKSSFPVKDVRLPGYMGEAKVQKVAGLDAGGSGDVYEVSVSSGQGAKLSSDIVFYYRLEDDVPARLDLIPYRSDPDVPGTFMAVVTPAASLQRISEGTDWMFVLDTSGSMGGHKIATLADGVSQVLGKLSAQDRFSVVTFNNSARELTPGLVPATQEKTAHWIDQVKRLQANGGTNLFAGLRAAFQQLDDDRSTGVILVTDGVANVGETQHTQFLKLLEKYDVRLFSFVIGNSANQPLMDRLSNDSGGFAMNLSDADDITGRLIQARAKLSHQCLHDVELKFSGEKVRGLTPGKFGNLYQGQQLVAFGRYDTAGDVEIVLSGRVSGEDRSWSTRVRLPETDTANPEIERLWALSAIEDQMIVIREQGESEGPLARVVDLATEYSLVTEYTSMVVVREDVMEEEGLQRRNADRVRTERQAQRQRTQGPVKNYRADGTATRVQPTPPQSSGNQDPGDTGMFRGLRAPRIGSGPVGPLFLVAAAWAARRKRKPR